MSFDWIVYKELNPDLEKKILFYLTNKSLLQAISTAGLKRTVKDHLFKNRFKNLFNRMGLN